MSHLNFSPIINLYWFVVWIWRSLESKLPLIFTHQKIIILKLFNRYCFIFSPLFSFFYYFFFFFNFYFYFILLYITILVLPYIDMNPPWVYMSSQTWIPLPPPTPYHLSGSSWCTSPKHPVSCIKHRLAICFLHDSIHVSMPFSQIIPPSPSPSESKSLLYLSVSFLLSCIQGHHCHLSKFHIYVLVGASLVAQRLKHLLPMWETWVQSLGREDPLEKEMATHSSSLA